ncbi:MAG: hypothetical protein KAU20_03235 [Nanoarchaeota archaeon]|nr:hypothetical protein [Nanoarchaeota archaeon]
MANQQIISYIKEQIKKGYDLISIRNYLIKYGYSQQDVDAAINAIYHPEVKHVVHHISNKTIIAISLIGLLIVLLIPTLYIYLSEPTAETKLLDLRTSLVTQTPKQGSLLEFNIELSNLGKAKRYDVVLKHEVLGKDISREETIAVETSASKKSSIRLPDDFPLGRYTLRTTADYDGKKAYSSFVFNIYNGKKEKIEERLVEEEIPEEGIEEIKEELPEPIVQEKKPAAEDFLGLTIWEKLDKIKEIAETNPVEAESYCNQLELESHKDECYYNIAEITKNPLKCREISNERTKDRCYNNVAKTTDNKELCKKIVKETRRDSCYMNFVNKGDYSVCGLIQNSYLRGACEALKQVGEIPEVPPET